MENKWHNLETEKILEILKTNINGLKEEEAERRREIYGKNVIPEEKHSSRFKIFFNQFKSPLIYILIIAGLVTLFLGKWTDSLVIFAAVLINSVFGFWQENKVFKILDKLKHILKTKAVVLRNGEKKEVFQEDLVPGDVILLKPGDKVPADTRLVESDNLKISEAVLTGEWIASSKETSTLPENTHLADRENMAYMGCLVEHGKGKAIVVSSGLKTEVGKIASLVKGIEKQKTPLEKKIAGFSKTIGIAIGSICILIFIGGLWRGIDLLEIFESSVAIAVGGIPEALPVVVTVILAIGTERILRKKGLVKGLASVETLGSTQIICFDKTRTLTQGKMELAHTSDNDSALKIAVLCSDAFVENPKDSIDKWEVRGGSTDAALLIGGAQKGFLRPEMDKESIEIKKLPFDSEYKYQLSLRKENNEIFLYFLGAPEKLLERSLNKDGWEEELEKMTGKGLRVLGAGYKKIKDHNKDLNSLAYDFTFAGLVALKDPLRPDTKEAIEECIRAGIRPILVTGDHKLTALAVAKEIGIETSETSVLNGIDIDRLSDEEFSEKLEDIDIYARVEPRHKMRIISAWQEKGKVVAMTGDGVNDAPALRRADIGLALGSGTEVAKESADLILLNDSFGIIVKTIEEGRVILDNLRKSISYALADSLTSVTLVGFATIIFGWPLPILPVQILWNNFVEDTLPSISYAFEPKEKGIMKRGPSLAKESLLNKEMKILIFATGLIDEFILLGLFWFLWKKLNLDLDYVRTMIFGGMCIDTVFVVFCYKSLRKNIWNMNPFSNKWLNISSVLAFVFFTATIYLLPLQKILHTVPLGWGSWLILLAIGIISMFLIEATKWYFISRHECE